MSLRIGRMTFRKKKIMNLYFASVNLLYVCGRFIFKVSTLRLPVNVDLSLMKRIISSVLLVVLLFNIGGYYLWFTIKQHQLKNEIRNEIIKGLDEKDLSLIVVSQSDKTSLRWVEAGKEFRYKGEMYDVVKVKIVNKALQYYCLKDSKEQQLINRFSKTNSKKKNEKTNKTHLNNLYTAQTFSFQQKLTASDITYPGLHIFYESAFPEIHSPPPRNT